MKPADFCAGTLNVFDTAVLNYMILGNYYTHC